MEDPTKVPHWLKHRPVYTVNDYATIDGRYVHKNSDAKGISLGIAQWSSPHYKDISAKIWRYTGEKWSRQSEELPLHRVLDLAILITKAIQYSNGINNEEKSVGAIHMQNKELDIILCKENSHMERDLNIFNEQMNEDKAYLDERLVVLANELKKMGY